MNNEKKQFTILRKVCNTTYGFLKGLGMVCLVVMVMSVIMAVFSRYITQKSMAWAEELAIICIVWLCMLSAQMGVYEGTHIRMTLIENILPEKIWKGIYRYADIVPLIVNVIIVIFGCKIASTNGMNRLPSSGWPLLTEYLALIVSGAAGTVLALGRIIMGERKDG